MSATITSNHRLGQNSLSFLPSLSRARESLFLQIRNLFGETDLLPICIRTLFLFLVASLFFTRLLTALGSGSSARVA